MQVDTLTGNADVPYFRYNDGSSGSNLFEANPVIASGLWTGLTGVAYTSLLEKYRGDGLQVVVDVNVRGVDAGLTPLGLGEIDLNGRFKLRVNHLPASGGFPERFLIYEALAEFEIDDVFDYDYFSTVVGLPVPLEPAELQCGSSVYGDGGQVFGITVAIRHQLDVGAGLVVTSP
jgi:hypothetical protein